MDDLSGKVLLVAIGCFVAGAIFWAFIAPKSESQPLPSPEQAQDAAKAEADELDDILDRYQRTPGRYVVSPVEGGFVVVDSSRGRLVFFLKWTLGWYLPLQRINLDGKVYFDIPPDQRKEFLKSFTGPMEPREPSKIHELDELLNQK